MMAYCQEHGIGVHIAKVFGSGGMLVPKTGVNAGSVRNNSPAAFAEQRAGWAALATKHGPRDQARRGRALVCSAADSCHEASGGHAPCGGGGESCYVACGGWHHIVPPQLWREAQASGLLAQELELP